MNLEKLGSDQAKTHKKSKYLDLALYAFGGLGLEVVIMMIEGIFYGTNNYREWGMSGTLLHWVITCIVWGSMSYLLYRQAYKGGFDLLKYRERPTAAALCGVVVLICICLSISYISWGGQFKVVAEFGSKINTYGQMGWIAYIFQYIYYFFETVLVLLIIAFGQQYGELTFRLKPKWGSMIPWGGIICGISWGIVHMLTKGSLSTGLVAAFCSVLYGMTYLLMKKNVRYAYLMITLMFVL